MPRGPVHGPERLAATGASVKRTATVAMTALCLTLSPLRAERSPSETGARGGVPAASDWIVALPSPSPSGLSYHAMAYDRARRRVVLFGGEGSMDRADRTWEWNGRAWAQRSPSTSPSARESHSMAYDDARGRVVLFGGSDQSGLLADTWEWDGSSWVEKARGTGPPPRGGHAMAYDSARGRIVLFGGYGNGRELADTWEWDGNSWAERTSAASPSAREGHAMAYDAARGRTVVFGGLHESGTFLSDTWEWDGDTWNEQKPASSPPARGAHAMAYSSERGEVLLFGGTQNPGELADTWVWNGIAWIEKTPTGGPPARDGCASAYDSVRDRIVLFGGMGLSDTWEWDGEKWEERTPATSPPPRSEHAMTFDSARGRTVLFGGTGMPGDLGDTWEWDGSTWEERTPAVSPPARRSPAMAYDAARGRVVLFGGIGGAEYSDTWEWDGSTWEERTPTVSPPARADHGMAYDAARERVVLFGGYFSSGDTWEWDGSDWVEKTGADGPAGRHGHAMAYDAVRGRVVLFGGVGWAGIFVDTWEWDGSSWTERTSATGPSEREGFSMAFDRARARIVLFGGGLNTVSMGYRMYADTWEWDGISWRQTVPASNPPGRAGHALAYDDLRGRIVMVGGVNQAGALVPDRATWEYAPLAGCGHAARVAEFVPGSGAGDDSVAGAVGPADGLAVSLGIDGSIVLQTNVPVIDGPGTDLVVSERGANGGGIDENFHVEASEDGVDFVFLRGCAGGECQVDLLDTGLASVSYIRLTDLPPRETGTAFPYLGADIDAVTATHCSSLEACNGLDDDGDGFVPPDEADHDGDRHVACWPWSGSNSRIDGGGDCNDSDSAIRPGAAESCNGLDDDCTGRPDEGFPDADTDGVADCVDNCTEIYNPDQAKDELDALGDACEPWSLFHAADFSADGFSFDRIDGRDLFVFASSYGLCPGDAGYDPQSNIDRVPSMPGSCVDADDLHLFLNEFGTGR